MLFQLLKIHYVAQVGIIRPKIGPDISQPNQVLTRLTLCAQKRERKRKVINY